MKIVYFIDHLRADGTQRVLTQLVQGLAQQHTQFVFCLNNSYDPLILQNLARVGARVEIIGGTSLLSGRGILQIWRCLRRERFDVAVTLLFVSDVIGRTLAHFARVPRIVTSIRARNINYTRAMLFLSRLTMQWADAVILNSRGVRAFAMQQEGARSHKLYLIPNGIEASEYAASLSRAELDETFGLRPDAFVLGSVGRLTKQKGYDVLLDALAQLDSLSIDLILIGEGEERAALQAKLHANASGAARVHFAGYRRDVPRLLGAFDAYVQPSRFEGMPNAVLEAMAAGCPIVATNIEGTNELIEDGVHGWLVAPENTFELARALQKVLTQPVERSKRGAAARERAARDFGIDAMVRAWERVLTND